MQRRDAGRSGLRGLRMAAGLVLCVGAAGAALAAYPERPVRLVSGFGPGSATDNVTRIVADALSKELGQQVVVESRAGAGGTISASYVAGAAPDGYTLLMGTNSAMSTGPAGAVANVGYDPTKDFTPVGKVATVGFMLVGNNDLKQADARALFADIKASAKDYNCAFGNTNGLVFCSLLDKEMGNGMTHVPYKSTPPALQDLIGGRVNIMFIDLPTGAPRAQQGQVRAYAVTSEKRYAGLKDVPTMVESGLKDFPPNYGWWGVYGPPGMSADVQKTLSTALANVLAQPSVQQSLERLGVEVASSGPEELHTFHVQDYTRWQAFIKDFDIRP